jgi:PAS domain-containing protein
MDAQSHPTPNPARGSDAEHRHIVENHAGSHRIGLISESFQRVVGKPLLSDGSSLWGAPMVILAHGRESDPVFFYANRMALTLFELTASEAIRLPSRFSAEPMERAARAAFLQTVTERNFIADYSGIRISRNGKRFRIGEAIVWNLIDTQGHLHGQAACFDQWQPIE